MISKIYRYKLAESKWPEFIELQKKADALYSKHVSYEIKFIRDLQEPLKITEVHAYPDMATAKKAEGLHAVEPKLAELFRYFTSILSPDDKNVTEELGETFEVRE